MLHSYRCLLTAALINLLPACNPWKEKASQSSTANTAPGLHSYETIDRYLDLTRQFMVRPMVRKFLNEIFEAELTMSADSARSLSIPFDPAKPPKLEFSESHLLELLLLIDSAKARDAIADLTEYVKDPMSNVDPATIQNPEQKEMLSAKRRAWHKKFREFVDDNRLKSLMVKNQVFEPLLLIEPQGGPGYTNARLFANHERVEDGKVLPPEDLKRVWIDFIRGAQKELVFNVFDFDLKEVAQAVIERKNAGVKVRLGIDAGVIAARPEVKEVYEMLRAAGVKVTAVDSVGLNHQKMAARDWSTPQAVVLLSSGNLTQSCIGMEGDLVGKSVLEGGQYSIPNANHVVLVESRLLGMLIDHELTKTLELGLRGTEYPRSGLFRIAGPGRDNSLVIGFSPRGGFGDLNRDFIAQVIRKTNGPIKMLQFAFSSKIIEQALFDRAKRDGPAFDFMSVGDTPFAVRDWSVFLSMSGYRLKDPGEPGDAFLPEKCEQICWKSAVDLNAARPKIRVAPDEYGTHSAQLRGRNGGARRSRAMWNFLDRKESPSVTASRFGWLCRTSCSIPIRQFSHAQFSQGKSFPVVNSSETCWCRDSERALAGPRGFRRPAEA